MPIVRGLLEAPFSPHDDMYNVFVNAIGKVVANDSKIG